MLPVEARRLRAYSVLSNMEFAAKLGDSCVLDDAEVMARAGEVDSTLGGIIGAFRRLSGSYLAMTNFYKEFGDRYSGVSSGMLGFLTTSHMVEMLLSNKDTDVEQAREAVSGILVDLREKFSEIMKVVEFVESFRACRVCVCGCGQNVIFPAMFCEDIEESVCAYCHKLECNNECRNV